MVAALFGHSDTPSFVGKHLEQEVIHLIEENKNILFLVGTQGKFDKMAIALLKKLSLQYPKMKYYIVLAYLPVNKENNPFEGQPTMFPEGIENVPKKFAICYRNNYMVKVCDCVLCYIARDRGGAVRYVEKAKRQGKTIINLFNAAPRST